MQTKLSDIEEVGKTLHYTYIHVETRCSNWNNIQQLEA